MSAEAVYEMDTKAGIQKDLDYSEGLYRLAMAIGVQDEADFESFVFEICNGVSASFPDTLPSEPAIQMAHERVMGKVARTAGKAVLSVVEKSVGIDEANDKKWFVPC